MFPQRLSDIMSSTNYHLQLQQQVLKDFYGFEDDFPSDFAVNCYTAQEIMELVHNSLVKIMEQGERILLQLLYKIDLPEKEFLKIIEHEQLSTALTKAVFEKEINKIYFRIKYKDGAKH